MGEGVDLLLEGLVVLALDLEFGLQLFDEELEAGDFATKFLHVGGARRRTRWCLYGRLRGLRGSGQTWHRLGDEGVG